ncbi:ribokinase [Microbacterium mangrovi]|uniref:Ribokinase n=1 Tax=Microbacterium mangrovi TaxID=1348253 RepID=A0A0B2A446_9MICO|nr:ribokinase [Microbacterium mangrovi]KHK96343.1 ribokinase [Microbacterium mangrovi]
MSDRPLLTVAGAINVDLTACVSRAPGPGETVADGRLTRLSGGKGANQAVASARLGARVRMVGAVGDDPDGNAQLANLAASDVDTASVQRVGAPTGSALIVVDDNGENSIVVCPGANLHIDASALRVDPHTAVLAQLEIPVTVVESIVAATDGFVAINVSPAGAISAQLRERGDLFIVNETEYAAHPELETARMTAVTLGDRGAVLLREGVEVARARVEARGLVSTVGAGDAFAAALTLGIIRGDNLPDALHRACAVGASAVEQQQSQPALRPLESYLPRVRSSA